MDAKTGIYPGLYGILKMLLVFGSHETLRCFESPEGFLVQEI